MNVERKGDRMTVEELRRGLSDLPPDAEVHVYEGEGEFILVWEGSDTLAEFDLGGRPIRR